MKKLTSSQKNILNNIASLSESDLTLDTPFNIARRPFSCMSFLCRQYGKIVFVRGYSKAAYGLVQRGILIRDKEEEVFWLTTFGINYVKEL